MGRKVTKVILIWGRGQISVLTKHTKRASGPNFQRPTASQCEDKSGKHAP